MRKFCEVNQLFTYFLLPCYPTHIYLLENVHAVAAKRLYRTERGVGHGALLEGYTPACPDRADTRGVAEVAVASSVCAHMARGDTASMLVRDGALLVLVALASRRLSSENLV